MSWKIENPSRFGVKYPDRMELLGDKSDPGRRIRREFRSGAYGKKKFERKHW
jgi:hypothetical protein